MKYINIIIPVSLKRNVVKNIFLANLGFQLLQPLAIHPSSIASDESAHTHLLENIFIIISVQN